jgi:hypothetical protein
MLYMQQHDRQPTLSHISNQLPRNLVTLSRGSCPQFVSLLAAVRGAGRQAPRPDACQLVRLWLHSNQDGRPDDARRVKNAFP